VPEQEKTETAAGTTEGRTEPQLSLPADETKAGETAKLPELNLPEYKPGLEYKTGSPPPLPNSLPIAKRDDSASETPAEIPPGRRSARRRAAGPVRGKIAANDDAPSIGGLIYALDQKPANKPFLYAGIASAVWAVLGLFYAWSLLSVELAGGATLGGVITSPAAFTTAAAILVPIAVLYFLALLAWRSEELRLRSSTMTEVAVRLAEPDRMAEQSVASLGQAVRRQVSFMNDAVSRALGRAGELEALVHNEVSALERSYEENERKIRGLIEELSGERDALLNTSRNVTDTLRTLGTDIPGLIEKLSMQQIKLAQIIQGAGENLNSLETAVSQSATRLESTLGARTDELQNVLDTYATAIGSAIGSRTDQIQGVLEGYTAALADALSARSQQFQNVFEEYGRALDTTLTARARTLDSQLVERTRALDQAFADRLRLFDESIMRSTSAIDSAVTEKQLALTSALDNHARTFRETVARQSIELDETLMQGISSVRRSSENITRQSLKAIEGLAGQSEMLRNVSENLLSQIHTVTNRFENQGQSIMKAANALESANYKIDATLQSRHSDLSRTLERLTGKADEFGRFVEGYSTTIEGSLSEAEQRARSFAEQIQQGTEATKRSAFSDLERLRLEADQESQRALEDLRRRFASVSTAVSEQLDTLSSRFDQTSDDVRQRAQRAAAEIAAEQARLRDEIERLPIATRESTETMRRALQDQMKALEQLSSFTTRSAHGRDVRMPVPASGAAGSSLTGSYMREVHHPDYASRQGLSQLGGLAGASEALHRGAPGRGTQQAALPRPPLAPQGAHGDARDSWSLGDLLARASRDEESHVPASATGQPYMLQVDVIARALDAVTASALWSRIRAGQTGVMVRSIYSPDGRAAFDEISRRYRTDPELSRTVDRYIADFERIRADSELRDPTGRLTEGHMTSDTGRVYLFLAHATGRL
jgi:hypothetical protein